MHTQEMEEAMAILKQFSEKEKAYDRYMLRVEYLREQNTMREDKEIAEAELKKTMQDLHHFENKLEQSENKLEQSENKLEQSENKLEQSENKLERSESKLEQSKSKLEQSEMDLNQLRQSTEEKDKEIEKLKQQLLNK
ncbi:hypothetical protein [sulfur-oxidizing endosymbiont of Gigantopelta aegis]|uniref:hypothetical protein n=1 Tax=sulfur-oxidizing endosymbiont of Gigantopelta aegis TaxID=2794934 RepID=UPI0018DB4A5E|nr:hypothetical protein [sulfur-oxidizing endosymbiont of Gigantopelta aegis]